MNMTVLANRVSSWLIKAPPGSKRSLNLLLWYKKKETESGIPPHCEAPFVEFITGSSQYSYRRYYNWVQSHHWPIGATYALQPGLIWYQICTAHVPFDTLGTGLVLHAHWQIYLLCSLAFVMDHNSPSRKAINCTHAVFWNKTHNTCKQEQLGIRLLHNQDN